MDNKGKRLKITHEEIVLYLNYAVASTALSVRLWKPWCNNLAQSLKNFLVLVVKNLPANAGDAGDMGLISGSEKSPGEGNGNPLSVFLPGEFHGPRSLAGYAVAKKQTGRNN